MSVTVELPICVRTLPVKNDYLLRSHLHSVRRN